MTLLQSVMFLRLIPRLTLPVFTTQQVRHAGHNKWSNIKHIKGARDAELQKVHLERVIIGESFKLFSEKCLVHF